MERNNQKKNQQQERVCQKILKSISMSHPVQTIRRISNRSQSPSPAKPNPSAPINSIIRNIDIQTKPISPKLIAKPEAEPVHVEFDYSKPSNTKPEGPSFLVSQEKDRAAKIKPLLTDTAQRDNPITNDHGSTAKLGLKSNAIGTKPSASSAEPAKTQIKKLETKKSLGGIHMEERFTNFINNAKHKIRAVTNVGETMKTNTSDTTGVPNSEVSSKDQFSEYIRRAKMKMRTTSSIGGGNRRNDSLKYSRD